MRRKALGVALVLAFAAAAAVPGTMQAVSTGPWNLNPANGHHYQLVHGLPWEQAEAYAVTVGGHLATVNDLAEEAWLETTFTQPNLWIGFTDRAVEGTWIWVSGEPVTYTDWCPGQPDDWQTVGGEDYGFMNTDYCGGNGWDDADGAPLDGIVEVTGTPLTVGTIIGSTLGLPTTGADYSMTTKVSPLGAYVTWRGVAPSSQAGRPVGVELATRRPDGSWSPFTRLTSRTADPSGVVTFSWRSAAPAWISVRFRGDAAATPATQARWR